jgi:hypothetical protein
LTIGGNLRVTGSLTADNKITVPGNQKIEFTDTDVTNNLKLQLWSGYGLGINAWTLFYAANGKHSWRDNNGTNERMVLTTGADGSLTVNGTGTSSFAGNLTVSGAITAGGSDIYFTQTNHTHTGFGNTTGYAAIENASDYNALMILGRAGTTQGRCVKLWDYLEVNGNLKVNGSIIISNGVNSVTLSVDNTGLILSTTSSNHGANKKIKWDGDNNWDQI